MVAPEFARDHKVVLYDLTGSGNSDLTRYDFDRYRRLEAHAEDLVDIMEALDATDAVLVGHSVSATIVTIAANMAPERVGAVVQVGPSPRYIDDKPYIGGFSEDDVRGLLDMMEDNFIGWAEAMGPAIMGNSDREDLGARLRDSFCATDARIAAHFAHTTFNSDHRDQFVRLSKPTLALQCDKDIIAPHSVGDWIEASAPACTVVRMKAEGHCPHVSAPDETIAAIRAFLA